MLHPRPPGGRAGRGQWIAHHQIVDPSPRDLRYVQDGEVRAIVLEPLTTRGSPDCNELLFGRESGATRSEQPSESDVTPYPDLLEQQEGRRGYSILRT